MASEKVQRQRKNMTARVFSISEGLTEIEHVDFIRIKSERYGLLIMEDYMPTLGKIDGSVTIEAQGMVKSYEDIHGFYIHQQNLFRLMLREDKRESVS